MELAYIASTLTLIGVRCRCRDVHVIIFRDCLMGWKNCRGAGLDTSDADDTQATSAVIRQSSTINQPHDQIVVMWSAVRGTLQTRAALYW